MRLDVTFATEASAEDTTCIVYLYLTQTHTGERKLVIR